MGQRVRHAVAGEHGEATVGVPALDLPLVEEVEARLEHSGAGVAGRPGAHQPADVPGVAEVQSDVGITPEPVHQGRRHERGVIDGHQAATLGNPRIDDELARFPL
jgi:hypothetical protein